MHTQNTDTAYIFLGNRFSGNNQRGSMNKEERRCNSYLLKRYRLTRRKSYLYLPPLGVQYPSLPHWSWSWCNLLCLMICGQKWHITSGRTLKTCFFPLYHDDQQHPRQARSAQNPERRPGAEFQAAPWRRWHEQDTNQYFEIWAPFVTPV